MNKRRLLALAKFLEEKVPREDFNFTNVCRLADYDSGLPYPRRLTPKCGAVGCAIGWAPSMRCFKEEGWHFKDGNLINKENFDIDYIAAGMQMFNISYEESEFLFTPGPKKAGWSGLPDEATPKQVARHIRKFVEKKEKEMTE